MLGPKRTFESRRPIPSKPTKRSEGDALPCSPRVNTPTIHGVPTSSLRRSGWWMRCPCPCGCRARARGRPPSWCGAQTDRERGQWRPPPPRLRCTPRSMAMSQKWLSPRPSTRRCRPWGTTTRVTYTGQTARSRGNEPLTSGRLPAKVSPASGHG